MKTAKRIAVVLIIAIVLVLIGHHFSYPIKLNMVTLPNYIADYYHHGRSTDASTIVLYDGACVEIDDKMYCLIEVDEDLGSVTLKESPLGRYKIENLSHGGGNFNEEIIESKGKKYLLLSGRDITAQIFRIKVSIEGQSYDLYNRNLKDHFLLCTEVDYHIEDNHVDRDKIVLYNEKGEDITAQYDLNGGGF